MKRYSIFHPYILSFFSKRLYQDVAAHWKGCGFLYLFILSLFLSVVCSVTLFRYMGDEPVDWAKNFINQVPSFNIKDGKLKTEEDKTYFLKDGDSGEVIAIINPSAGYDTSDIPVVVTGSEITIKKSEIESRTFKFAQVGDFEYKKGSLDQWIESGVSGLLGVIVIFLFPFIAIGVTLWNFLKALLFSIIGLILSAIMKTGLNYGTILRLTAIALTPTLILQALGQISGITFLSQSALIYFVLVVIYQIFALVSVKSIPQEEQI